MQSYTEESIIGCGMFTPQSVNDTKKYLEIKYEERIQEIGRSKEEG